eukprot:9539161-Ditylum_brightwellii.AAC.1
MHQVLCSTIHTKGAELGKLTKEDLHPGYWMSLDQYVVKHKGCTHSTASDTSTMYNGSTMFKDHASKMIFAFNQISLRSGETLQGKCVVDKEACAIGYPVRSFHANNGAFTSAEFKTDLTAYDQTIRFSGIGCPSNGIAECNMKTTFYLAQAPLIYSTFCWHTENDISLWLFALQHVAYVLNHTQGKDGWAPIEKRLGFQCNNHNHLWHFMMGMPAYVLDPTLQDGKKSPNFNPCALQGKLLGYSSEHATNVGLILNLNPKRISPQFHVLYNDFFMGEKWEDIQDPVLTDIDWDHLIYTLGTHYHFDADNTHLVPPVHPE